MPTVKSTIDVMSDEEVIVTYRIVNTDNFGGDYPDESLTCVGIDYEKSAEEIAKYLNRGGDYKPRFFRVVRHVEIRYKLVPGFEP